MPTRYKPIPNIALLEAAAQIRQAMRAGNIAEAVNLFHQTGERESASLFEKFSEAQDLYKNHLIDLEAWGRAQAQICQSILRTDCMLETEMPQNLPSEMKDKILQLLHQHKTAQALALCEGFGDQYLLLQAQLNAVKNQCGTGLIASEYLEATKSKLNYALQALLGQMMESSSAPKSSLLDKIRSLFK